MANANFALRIANSVRAPAAIVQIAGLRAEADCSRVFIWHKNDCAVSDIIKADSVQVQLKKGSVLIRPYKTALSWSKDTIYSFF